MTVDFTRYTPPGVYVEAQPTTVVTPGGVPGTTVALVGISRGYQMHTQSLSLTTEPKVLARRGVLPNSSAPIRVSKIDGTLLAAGTHYTLTLGGTADSTSTISYVAGAATADPALVEGDTVVISYGYADSTYFAARRFDDYATIERVYGPALVGETPTDPAASHVLSPLSMAARVALENGAGEVLCVAVEPPIAANPTAVPPIEGVSLQARFIEAYEKIASLRGITVMVPVLAPASNTIEDRNWYRSNVASMITDARVHAEQASNEGYGRVTIVGVDNVYDEFADGALGFDEIAANNVSKRLVLPYPNRLLFFNNRAGQHVEVGGQYLAAALGGRLAANEVRRGLTQEPVYSFTGIPPEVLTEMNRGFRNNLSANGVTVVEPGRASRLTVRHGVTTSMANLLDREIGVVRTADMLYQMVAFGMEDAGLIGDPIDEQTTAVVSGILTGILETAVQEDIILDYTDVDARQGVLPGGDPTMVECSFTYRPFLPLNYITVTFSVDMTTGQISETQPEAVLA